MVKKSLLRKYPPFGRVIGYYGGGESLGEYFVPFLKIFQSCLRAGLVNSWE